MHERKLVGYIFMAEPNKPLELGPCLDASQKLEFFHSLSITSIFRLMHEVVNVGKKKLITQFSWKSRDESFEPSWSTIGQYLLNKTKVVLFIGFKKFAI
jgi:hypothetical protein